ncbi:MAG: ribosome-associated translation inhibitor RaiA [Lachnospiraceae bacterium]|nr:ribosome-associated translation inhibitor RaiA [Lachnospiraceae bacterium]
MRFNIIGRNIDVTEGLKSAIYEKLGKLGKYFQPDTPINVTLSVEKDSQKIEVTIPVKGNIIRSEQESTDMYVSIDLVEEIIERQLKKYKTKLTDANKGAVSISDFAESYIEEDFEESEEIRIERTKRFAVKPMDPEEACMQMELLGHTFFVFRSALTEEINVVYKRKNGTYGLIEPEY